MFNKCFSSLFKHNFIFQCRHQAMLCTLKLAAGKADLELDLGDSVSFFYKLSSTITVFYALLSNFNYAGYFDLNLHEVLVNFVNNTMK